MNGESTKIPQVPVTTLAGTVSLSELLPELPLPSSVNRVSPTSLLFHPRVAEEAQRHLVQQEPGLVKQLTKALQATSQNQIELKNKYVSSEYCSVDLKNAPPLLQGILQCNSLAFEGTLRGSAEKLPPIQKQSNHINSISINKNSLFNDSSLSSGIRIKEEICDKTTKLTSTKGDTISIYTENCDKNANDRKGRRCDRIEKGNAEGIKSNKFESLPKHKNNEVKDSGRVDRRKDKTNEKKIEKSQEHKYEKSDERRINKVEEKRIDKSKERVRDKVEERKSAKLQERKSDKGEENKSDKGKPKDKHSANNELDCPPNDSMKEPVLKLFKLSDNDLNKLKSSDSTKSTKSSRSARERSRYSEIQSDSEDSNNDSKKPVKYFKSREKDREEKKKKDKAERKRHRSSDDEYDPYLSVKKSKFDEEDSDEYDPESKGACDKRGQPPPKMSPKKAAYNQRRIERKVAGVTEKLSNDELMETGVYNRFTRAVEKIFDTTDEIDLTELEEADDIPQEFLIPKYELHELMSESAKLKSNGGMSLVPKERLVKLLNILEKNIRDGAKVTPIVEEDDEEDDKLWLELVMERILRAVDASLTVLYIMTSSNMNKRVYMEDVIERCIQFSKFQLSNTIYPSFDPVYRIENKRDGLLGNMRRKRAHVKDVRNRNVLTLYNKLHEVVGLIADLLGIQTLTDTTVLQLSTLGVAPFFVENVPELQLSALRLVTTVFARYDKHRRLLLDDILASIARLPSSKRSLRTYRLNSDENIQMLTALVLQLIQCVVELPDELSLDQCRTSEPVNSVQSVKENSNHTGSEDKNIIKPSGELSVDRDVLVSHKYENALGTAYSFLSVFLQKTGSKSEEIDYRPLFENFVQDLLLTVNKPEWPASELLLSFLGKLLVQKFSNKNTDVSLRVSSLDCLGIVAARLRKDTVTSHLKIDKIDSIINEIRQEEKEEVTVEPVQTLHPEVLVANGPKKSKKKNSRSASKVETPPKPEPDPIDLEEERNLFLQRVLLDWLAVNASSDSALLHARHFYIGQWYRDAYSEILRQKQGPIILKTKHKKIVPKRKKRRRRGDSDDSEESEPSSEESDVDDPVDETTKIIVQKLAEKRKKFLLTKVPSLPPAAPGSRMQSLQTHIDYENAELITRYLASRRSFSQSFDSYLKQILRVLSEPAIAVRTKAMKCLTMVVEADPSVLARSDMRLGVHHSFLDHSTSVREAAVDLVGKFVLSNADLIEQYYEMIAARILDTGVSVRKRVIKILKDVCLEYPEFKKIPEICVKMIRRVNDEEGIKKLVQEVFQNMWFSPVKSSSSESHDQLLLTKVNNITEVVIACKDTGLDWFEQLLQSMFRPKEDKEDVTKVNTEPPKALIAACQQIINCLVRHILVLEEKGLNKTVKKEEKSLEIESNKKMNYDEKDVNRGGKEEEPEKKNHQDNDKDEMKKNMEKEENNKQNKEKNKEEEEEEVKSEEKSNIKDEKIAIKKECSSDSNNQRLSACLTTLYLFSKIRPQLLVDYAITLQPYLALKCQSQSDYNMIGVVARTLELVVPLMEHPSENFLAQLEGDAVKLILMHDRTVINSCLALLGSIVNTVTKNYSLIRDCFNKYYSFIVDYQHLHSSEPGSDRLEPCKPYFRRALYTVGLLLRHFDFHNEEVRCGLAANTSSQVVETLMYFIELSDKNLQYFTLQSLGSVCIRHYNLMMGIRLKALYHRLLLSTDDDVKLKIQTLLNIESYLQEEEIRMIREDQEWAKKKSKEDLKEMCDVQSGMASTIIQIYLKQILECVVVRSVAVRQCALRVIQLVLAQGLVHPVQIVPYLICMSTDPEEIVAHSADKQLQDIEKKYPGFINMKAMQGFRLSYRLQTLIQERIPTRGFKQKDGEAPGALNGFLYSCMRGTKQQRRAVAMSLLKQFDELAKTPLADLLYIADNLAYFPYQVSDEPLFIVHHIDVMISVTGANILQLFREAIFPHLKKAAEAAAAAEAIVAAEAAERERLRLERMEEAGDDILTMNNHIGEALPLNNFCIDTNNPCSTMPNNLVNHNSVLTLPIPAIMPTVSHILAEEEEEDLDEQTLIESLPHDLLPLVECTEASQGCLLLLMLKDHLKEVYGITDGKIWHYSPSDTTKQYEKSCSKKSNAKFDPKRTQQVLKCPKFDPNNLSEKDKKTLIDEYLGFRDLMLKIDQEDEANSDDEGNEVTNQNHAGSMASRQLRLQQQAQKQDDIALLPGTTDGWKDKPEEQTVPDVRETRSHGGNSSPIKSITIRASQYSSPKDKRNSIRHHQKSASSHKKHRKKKKRRRFSDSEQDSNSDSDFCA